MNGGGSAARPVALPLTGPTSCFVGRIRQRRHPAGRPRAYGLLCRPDKATPPSGNTITYITAANAFATRWTLPEFRPATHMRPLAIR